MIKLVYCQSHVEPVWTHSAGLYLNPEFNAFDDVCAHKNLVVASSGRTAVVIKHLKLRRFIIRMKFVLLYFQKYQTWKQHSFGSELCNSKSTKRQLVTFSTFNSTMLHSALVAKMLPVQLK